MFRECTLAQPTWCFHRDVWLHAGGYDESFRRCDDLRFFYRHVAAGGALLRIDDDLVLYRYSGGGCSSSLTAQTPRRELVRVRVDAFLRLVVLRKWPPWRRFAVWGAGRDGKCFLGALEDRLQELRLRAEEDAAASSSSGAVVSTTTTTDVQKLSTVEVSGVHDVDEAKVRRGTYVNARTRRAYALRPLDELRPPFVVCVALDRYRPELLAAVQALGRGDGVSPPKEPLVEGRDFWFFS
mmetsp:Transcript_7482/g.30961  ORF Transcript_7482/g.30961 Transcript_7482/m.30961 type:complete len:239 (-) Transcript_7482:100-816(-)